MRDDDLRQQLADAQETIRALREELAETNRGLVALNLELEGRVAERTAELATANDALKREIVERMRVEEERERLLASTQEAKAQAETAVKARDEFLSIAAHELKTPVTSIHGFAQVMLRQFEKTGGFDAARMSRALETMVQQSRRLTKLTEQLLNLSRLESGKLVLTPEEVDLVALVESCVDAVRHSRPERAIEFHSWNVDEVRASVDPLRLEQVVTNLLDNALKFSPDESPVEVDVETDDGRWAIVVVRDHGIGIPAEERSHIFERFFQAHSSNHYGGMGIGLSVCREITEMHGGSIVVEQPEDGGSRFIVRLPASGGVSDKPVAARGGF
ncbi:MAG: HAMP domain-containing histidine kinase [Actinobacteria bacterium]|nr:HAMP domain-containing histidine kinase [Actinomycetota bacterium]